MVLKNVIAGVCLFLIIGCSDICQIGQEEKEKPLIQTDMISWGSSEDNDNELLFSFYVYNFAYVEAKNLTAICNVKDLDGNMVFQKVTQIPNIGSTSYSLQQISAITDKIKGNKYNALCFVKCDNCIDLIGRIPELNAHR